MKSFLIVLVCSVVLLGQEKALTPGEIQTAYNALEYDRVIQLVKTELENNPTQNPDQLIIYLKYLALALYSTEGEEAARGALSSLLLVDPDFRFSPGEASPKIRALLETIRGETSEEEKELTETAFYITVKDRRQTDILVSVIRPGQGLINRGYKRGYVYRAGFTGAVLGAIAFTITTAQAHDDYLRAVDYGDINRTYDTYNFHYKMRNNLILVAAVTYLANLTDIYFTAR